MVNNSFLKLTLTLALIFFSLKINAQEVSVIDKKGTIKTINNNNVFTSATNPNTPTVVALENDIWIDTSTNPNSINIWNGTAWVDIAHTGTTGSLFFAGTDSKPTQNNSNLFWDNTNNRLGIGNNIPSESLHITNNMQLGAMFKDKDGDEGTSGQILSSTGTATDWIDINLASVVNKTTNYTLVATDNGKIITFNSATDITLTVPTGLPIGYNISIYQTGNGRVTINGAAGVTVLNRLSRFITAGKDAGAGLVATSTNNFHLTGDLRR